ncbi:MAG: hypothetical protein JWO86_4821 [Myxococcaceae bacterium]|nr:hypothetical protein [Myxococcaceae bacterium]MEA2749746.1 hypothetical protein [Myxococcales bacterium]
MNAGAPTCPKCGGLSINPGEAQCRFCGTPLGAQGAQGYGAAQPGYGAPPPGYGAPPPGYGAPPPGYGAPPPGYGGQPGYGAPPGYGGAQPMQQPMQPMPYGAPPGYGAPNPYGAPQYPYAAPYGQNPYGGPGQYPMAPVQGFNGNYGRQVNRGWGFGGGWSTFFWVRLAIAGVFISLSLLGACINAIAH